MIKMARPYIKFDFELARCEGNNVALVLAALIDHYEYFKSKKLLKNNEFFNTKTMLQSKVNLKPDAVRKAENRLVELDYIRTRLGKGNFKFYFINFAEINKPLINNITAQSVDIAALDVDIAAQNVDHRSLKRDASPLKAVNIAAQSGINHTIESAQTISTNNQPKATTTKQQTDAADSRSEIVKQFDDCFADF